MFEYKKKKKVCPLCAGHDLDYKDVDYLRRFISADRNKILPRRVTGTCAKHQREVANQVKYGRHMALIGFVR